MLQRPGTPYHGVFTKEACIQGAVFCFTCQGLHNMMHSPKRDTLYEGTYICWLTGCCTITPGAAAISDVVDILAGLPAVGPSGFMLGAAIGFLSLKFICTLMIVPYAVRCKLGAPLLKPSNASCCISILDRAPCQHLVTPLRLAWRTYKLVDLWQSEKPFGHCKTINRNSQAACSAHMGLQDCIMFVDAHALDFWILGS